MLFIRISHSSSSSSSGASHLNIKSFLVFLKQVCFGLPQSVGCLAGIFDFILFKHKR